MIRGKEKSRTEINGGFTSGSAMYPICSPFNWIYLVMSQPLFYLTHGTNT
ncbi:hypothetical protein [Priestia megaterium]|nr:hypothetical protein [Priestia megaterium]